MNQPSETAERDALGTLEDKLHILVYDNHADDMDEDAYREVLDRLGARYELNFIHEDELAYAAEGAPQNSVLLVHGKLSPTRVGLVTTYRNISTLREVLESRPDLKAVANIELYLSSQNCFDSPADFEMVRKAIESGFSASRQFNPVYHPLIAFANGHFCGDPLDNSFETYIKELLELQQGDYGKQEEPQQKVEIMICHHRFYKNKDTKTRLVADALKSLGIDYNLTITEESALKDPDNIPLGAIIYTHANMTQGMSTLKDIMDLAPQRPDLRFIVHAAGGYYEHDFGFRRELFQFYSTIAQNQFDPANQVVESCTFPSEFICSFDSNGYLMPESLGGYLFMKFAFGGKNENNPCR